MTTKIETDTMRVTLPDPWPDGYVGGDLIAVDQQVEVVNMPGVGLSHGQSIGWGYLGRRGPADKLVDREVHLVDAMQNIREPSKFGAAWGPWPSLEEARQAAWRAVADEEAQQAPRPRAAELHRCSTCQTTHRGERSPAVVLRPNDRVEVETDDGRVAFAGKAADWGGEVAAAVVTRARAEIETAARTHQREQEAADRALAASLEIGQSRGVRVVGVVAAVWLINVQARLLAGAPVAADPWNIAGLSLLIVAAVVAPLRAPAEHRRAEWLTLLPGLLLALFIGGLRLAAWLAS